MNNSCTHDTAEEADRGSLRLDAGLGRDAAPTAVLALSSAVRARSHAEFLPAPLHRYARLFARYQKQLTNGVLSPTWNLPRPPAAVARPAAQP